MPSKDILLLGGLIKETSVLTGAAERAISCMDVRKLPGDSASFMTILDSERTREERALMISPMSIPRPGCSGLSPAGSMGPARTSG